MSSFPPLSWKLIEKSFCEAALPHSPERLLSSFFQTAAAIGRPSLEARDDWAAFWDRLLPGTDARADADHVYQSTLIQLLTRAAMAYGYPAPLGLSSPLSALNLAGIIMASCLTPIEPMPEKGDDILPPSQLPSIRAWLVASLKKVPAPYADSPNGASDIGCGNESNRLVYLTGYAHPSHTYAANGHELAWALDNATALRMKHLTDRRTILLDTLPRIQRFLGRLDQWAFANDALARTKHLSKSWPRRPLFCRFSIRRESLSVTDLACAALTSQTWAKLVDRTDIIGRADQDKYLHSWAGVKTIRDHFSVPPGPARDAFTQSILSIIGPTSFAETEGKTVAHILMESSPQVGTVRSICRHLGPEIMGVLDDNGVSPLGVARQSLEDRYGQDPPLPLQKIAALERAILRASLKGTRRPRATVPSCPFPRRL